MKMIQGMKKRYQCLRTPAKASLWFLICGFAQKGISMLTTPIFTRLMTSAEYGRYNVYTSWLSIVEIMVTLNLAAGVYTRGLIKNEDDQDCFSSSLLGLTTTCVLIWSGIYILLHDIINDVLGISTFLAGAMLVESWAHAAYQFWANKERANFRYKKLVVLTFLYVFLRPLLGILAVLAAEPHNQVEARVGAMTFVNVSLFSVLFVVLFFKGKQYYNKKYWTYALRFNLPLLPHYLSQIVLSQSDRLMINSICGASETAYYSVAYTLAMVLQILNTSISATMNPWIYRKLKEGDYKGIGHISYGILMLIAAANLLIVVMAPELLRILAPADYAEAIWVVPPVTASVFFMFLYNLFATFEYYYEKTHYVTVATVIGAVLNVVLNAIFIPHFGFIAAGYTTLACYMLYAWMHYRFMQKVNRKAIGDDDVYNEKIILAISGGLLVAVFLVTLLYQSTIMRYASVAVVLTLLVWQWEKVCDIVGNMISLKKT